MKCVEIRINAEIDKVNRLKEERCEELEQQIKDKSLCCTQTDMPIISQSNWKKNIITLVHWQLQNTAGRH